MHPDFARDQPASNLGMLDVAMHLYHSVSLTAMTNGGEETLLRSYHKELSDLLGPERAAEYPIERAERHYELCLLDYSRVVLSYFWEGLKPNHACCSTPTCALLHGIMLTGWWPVCVCVCVCVCVW